MRGGGVEGAVGGGGCDEQAVMERVRGAVNLLAEGWPQHYPDGAVEWLLL
jgi:hypothetical protein